MGNVDPERNQLRLVDVPVHVRAVHELPAIAGVLRPRQVQPKRIRRNAAGIPEHRTPSLIEGEAELAAVRHYRERAALAPSAVRETHLGEEHPVVPREDVQPLVERGRPRVDVVVRRVERQVVSDLLLLRQALGHPRECNRVHCPAQLRGLRMDDGEPHMALVDNLLPRRQGCDQRLDVVLVAPRHCRAPVQELVLHRALLEPRRVRKGRGILLVRVRQHRKELLLVERITVLKKRAQVKAGKPPRRVLLPRLELVVEFTEQPERNVRTAIDNHGVSHGHSPISVCRLVLPRRITTQYSTIINTTFLKDHSVFTGIALVMQKE